MKTIQIWEFGLEKCLTGLEQTKVEKNVFRIFSRRFS